MRTEWSLFVKKTKQKQFEFPRTKTVLIQLCPEVLEKKDLLIPLIGFRYFVIIWPWKSAGYFIWKKKIESPWPKNAFAQFGRNWLKDSEEEGFIFNFINTLSLFRCSLPLEKDWVLHLYLNSLHLQPRMLWAWFG